MSAFTEYVATQFGKPTGIAGQLSAFVMNCLNRKQYRATAERLGIGETDTALDIGCGNGFMVKRIAQKNPQKLYGIDISADMVGKAAKRNRRYIRSGKVELLLADVQAMPFENCSVDKAYTINTVYFWKNIPAGLAEIWRILKPNGIFINTIYDKEWLDGLAYTQYGFTKKTTEQLRALTEQSGFEIVEVGEIEKNKSACIVAKRVG